MYHVSMYCMSRSVGEGQVQVPQADRGTAIGWGWIGIGHPLPTHHGGFKVSAPQLDFFDVNR